MMFMWHRLILVFFIILNLSVAIAGPSKVKHGKGLLPDDPAKVEKVPLVISSQHIKKQMQRALKGEIVGASQQRISGGKTDKTLPVVSITSPANGATVSGNVNIQMSASDNIGVVQVMLTIDGVNLISFSQAPYAYSWNTSGLASGSHTIKATAKDAAGNTASASISVMISGTTTSADSTPPVVSITSPASGATFESGVGFNVSVNATDNTGIAYVRFSIDGVAKGVAYTSPYSFSVGPSDLAAGTHTLTVAAYDGYNNVGSSSIGVVVNAIILPPPPVLAPSVNLIMPPVRNQGGEGACAPFAIAYAARSAEYFYKTYASVYNESVNMFSPEFVYDQIKIGDCGAGSAAIDALDLLKNVGVPTWTSMPYSSTNGCSLIPTAAQLLEAGAYKITGYSRLLTSDITAMKSMLMNNHPIIIGVSTDSSFDAAGPGFIWKTSTGNGVSHAIVITGYDDAKHAYKIMNSWGTAWGDQGYTWIDYDFLPTVGNYYSYVISN